MSNDYINTYNKEKYKQITIRISPEEADEIKAKAGEMHISIARLIVSACKAYSPETLTASTDNLEEITTTPTTGATETPTEGRQENTPDYTRRAGEDAQRAAENVRELTHSPTGKYFPAGRDQAENGSESENGNTPGQVKVYTETDLQEAIREAAQQAAQKAARQARQEIRREIKAQAIQATGGVIGAARRAKESTVNAVSTVSGLKPVRIRRPKK